jgi:hypothetical protein
MSRLGATDMRSARLVDPTWLSTLTMPDVGTSVSGWTARSGWSSASTGGQIIVARPSPCCSAVHVPSHKNRHRFDHWCGDLPILLGHNHDP